MKKTLRHCMFILSPAPPSSVRMEGYKVIKYINEGSFGKIYLVERLADERLFALKSIQLTGISRYQRVGILTEVKILLTNNSEFLLKCHDLFVHRRRLCIVTEYVDGGDLDAYVRRHDCIDADTVTQIFLKVCAGIHAMHSSHIIHRDIKPANVLVTSGGDVKICDFGICKHLGYAKVTNTMVGTPLFMSPEQMSNRHYDYKCDVWGIGCVLYTLLHRRYPFVGKSMHELRQNILTRDPFVGTKRRHSALNDVLRGMLNKNKTKRPSLEALLTAAAANPEMVASVDTRVCHRAATSFRSYALPGLVPASDRDWRRVVDQIRKDFRLPAINRSKSATPRDRTATVDREPPPPRAQPRARPQEPLLKHLRRPDPQARAASSAGVDKKGDKKKSGDDKPRLRLPHIKNPYGHVKSKVRRYWR